MGVSLTTLILTFPSIPAPPLWRGFRGAGPHSTTSTLVGEGRSISGGMVIQRRSGQPVCGPDLAHGPFGFLHPKYSVAHGPTDRLAQHRCWRGRTRVRVSREKQGWGPAGPAVSAPQRCQTGDQFAPRPYPPSGPVAWAAAPRRQLGAGVRQDARRNTVQPRNTVPAHRYAGASPPPRPASDGARPASGGASGGGGGRPRHGWTGRPVVPPPAIIPSVLQKTLA